jgi:hypothetical protein
MNQKLPEPQLVPLNFQSLSVQEQTRRAEEFYQTLRQRRTVRDFSGDPVPFELIERAIRAAGTAPSGANMQPCRFVVEDA